MGDIQAKQVNLVIGHEVQFGQHYEYHQDIPIETMLEERFFMPLRKQFFGGDHITLVRVDRQQRVKEEQSVRVVEVAQSFIELHPCGDRYVYPERDEAAAKSAAHERMAKARAAKAEKSEAGAKAA